MIAFSIGNFNVYWYGIFYFISFILLYLFLIFIGKKGFFSRYENLQKMFDKSVEDLLIFLILGVVIGGRLGEVFIYQWDYFSHNLLEIFAVRHGGMSFVGGFIGVLIALLIFKKVKKLSLDEFFLLSSILVLILPIAIMLGRFGNYLNQELYGIIIFDAFFEKNVLLSNVLSDLNIFHVYNNIDSNVRLNTNFLAILFEGLIPFFVGLFLFLKQYKKWLLKPYFNIGVFIIFYSIARFCLEYFRVGSQFQIVYGFSKSQWIFMLFFIIGVVFVIYGYKKMFKIH